MVVDSPFSSRQTPAVKMRSEAGDYGKMHNGIDSRNNPSDRLINPFVDPAMRRASHLNPYETHRREISLDIERYFCNYRSMTAAKAAEQITKYAEMFSAMGTEARLRIMQLLLSAHPDGLVVREIQEELGIPNSTLSHHLDKLKNEDLVRVQRESTYLRYTANTEALQEILHFLYAECCTRNKALKPQDITQSCR